MTPVPDISTAKKFVVIHPEEQPKVYKSVLSHVEIELHEQGSATMEKSVLEGEVGIALLTTFPKHADLYYDLIQEEQLVLIVNRDCALAKRIRPGTLSIF